MLLELLHGMLIMLITLLLNLYHLVTHTSKRKKNYDLRHYFWDDPHLYKGVDGVIRRCVPEHEQEQILCKCHSEVMEDTMLEIELHIRYCNLVFIG